MTRESNVMDDRRTVPIDEEGNEVVIESPAHGDALAVLSPATKGEIDMQISTAKRYPRSIKAFKQQAMEMATLDEETAAGCFYSLPRGGKPIEGPSARLAEIVLSAWGNIRADARVIDAGPTEITAEAMTWDLEKNVAVRVQVKRRITDKNGRRYKDDMITVTGNAACSIALRNSVFKVIPMAYTKAVYAAARQVAIGDIKTLEARRADMVAYFGKMGIVPDRVYGAVGVAGIEEVGLDELAALKGLATAIKDGDTTVDEAFPVFRTDAKDDGTPRTQQVADRIKSRANGDAAPVGDAVKDTAAKIEEMQKGKAAAATSTDTDAAAAIESETTPVETKKKPPKDAEALTTVAEKKWGNLCQECSDKTGAQGEECVAAVLRFLEGLGYVKIDLNKGEARTAINAALALPDMDWANYVE